MDDWMKVSELKKEPLAGSCEIVHAHHCPMDVVLEELCSFQAVNALVIGVGECAFYSRKLVFPGDCRNWAYQISDSELIFGDLAGVRKALREISDNGYPTVCIVTCIPSIMNLDVESLLDEVEDAVVLKAPDFRGISANDILGELYLCFAKKAGLTLTGETADWKDGIDSVAELYNRFNARTHLVYSRKFIPALEELQRRFPVRIVDQTTFYPLDFYRENRELLQIDPDAITHAERIVQFIREQNQPVSIRSAWSCDLALFLQGCGCKIRELVFFDLNQYRYNQCKRLSPDVRISVNARTELSGEGLLLDLSDLDATLAEQTGFDRLLTMLTGAEELCR